MTPIAEFDASFERLFGTDDSELAEHFFASFYQRFTQHPQVSRLFAHTDMAKQISMLKRSIYDLVGFYVTGIPSAELARISQIHATLGIDANLLDTWLEALLKTVAEYDEASDDKVQLAWIAALSPGLTYIRLQLLGNKATGS